MSDCCAFSPIFHSLICLLPRPDWQQSSTATSAEKVIFCETNCQGNISAKLLYAWLHNIAIIKLCEHGDTWKLLGHPSTGAATCVYLISTNISAVLWVSIRGEGGILAADGSSGLSWRSHSCLEQLVEKWVVSMKKGKHMVRKKLELVSNHRRNTPAIRQSIWRVLLLSTLLWPGAIASMLFSLAVTVCFYLEVNNWGNGEETNQLKSEAPATCPGSLVSEPERGTSQLPVPLLRWRNQKCMRFEWTPGSCSRIRTVPCCWFLS